MSSFSTVLLEKQIEELRREVAILKAIIKVISCNGQYGRREVNYINKDTILTVLEDVDNE